MKTSHYSRSATNSFYLHDIRKSFRFSDHLNIPKKLIGSKYRQAVCYQCNMGTPKSAPNQ